MGTNETLSYRTENDLYILKKVPKEVLNLRFAILNRKKALAFNIIDFCHIDILKETDHFGYSSLDFAKKHGAKEYEERIMQRIKKEYQHKY